MALKRSEKEAIVAEVTEILNTSKSVVFLNFTGLDMQTTSNMRSKLRGNDISYLVAKKSLARIAIENSNISVEGELPDMAGELAVAYTNGDETAAAREIYEFQKEFEDKVSIQAGVFDGKLLGKSEMLEIAQIPGMQTLRGMFVNLVNSPLQRLAIVMAEISKTKAS